MSEEVNNVVESFGLTEKDILSITRNTIQAGFVGPDLKNKSLEKISWLSILFLGLYLKNVMDTFENWGN